MKKSTLIIISAFLLIMNMKAQNIDDALRYSQVNYNGTARFVSMGGAFTALGADLSAVVLNPASVGMYRSFEMSFTPQLQYNNVSTVFENTYASDYTNNFGLSQAGVVSPVYSTGKNKGLVNFNFAYSYVSTNNFDENITITGISDNSSMADYWARVSEGTYYQDLRYGEGIAYDAWVIDTITGSGAMSYGTVFSAYGETDPVYGQTIRRFISNYGYQGEHAFALGVNISNMFYFGTTLGWAVINYAGHYEHLEADYDNVIPDFKNFYYTNHFEAYGSGFLFKIGTVIRPIEPLRLGFAFHAPVRYRLDEYFYDDISSAFDNLDTYEFYNNPSRYTYSFTTPYRFLAGASFQVKKFAILSADYEFVDYSNARFSNGLDGYGYGSENESIRQALKSASNLRFGAEFRIKNIYLRGGYSQYGSALAEGEENENYSLSTYSAGIGFRMDGFFFDFGYSHASSNKEYFMYDDQPYLAPANIETKKNTFTTTLGFKF